MTFVLAISALAGLCIAFLLGDDTRSPRPAGSAAMPADGFKENPADGMAKALRDAIEGNKAR